jgi:hypothetical protein
MRTAASALLGVLLVVLALTTAPTASAHAVRIASQNLKVWTFPWLALHDSCWLPLRPQAGV